MLAKVCELAHRSCFYGRGLIRLRKFKDRLLRFQIKRAMRECVELGVIWESLMPPSSTNLPSYLFAELIDRDRTNGWFPAIPREIRGFRTLDSCRT